MNKKIIGFIVLAILYVVFYWVFPIVFLKSDWLKASLIAHGVSLIQAGIVALLFWAFS